MAPSAALNPGFAPQSDLDSTVQRGLGVRHFEPGHHRALGKLGATPQSI